MLYGRAELLDQIPAYKLRPAEDRFETGTGNFEGLDGVTAAVEYLAGVGTAYGDAGPGRVPAGAGRRRDDARSGTTRWTCTGGSWTASRRSRA